MEQLEASRCVSCILRSSSQQPLNCCFRDQWNSPDAWLVCQRGAVKPAGLNEICFPVIPALGSFNHKEEETEEGFVAQSMEVTGSSAELYYLTKTEIKSSKWTKTCIHLHLWQSVTSSCSVWSIPHDWHLNIRETQTVLCCMLQTVMSDTHFLWQLPAPTCPPIVQRLLERPLNIYNRVVELLKPHHSSINV